jgi:hypothetical protein
MLFTTRQRYVSWKGMENNKKAVIPSLSNYDGINNIPNMRNKKASGGANPIRHYRYQLNQTSDIPRRSSHIDYKFISKPGYLRISDNSGVCCMSKCNDNDPNCNKISKIFTAYMDNNDPYRLQFENAKYFTDISKNIYQKCMSCDPESFIIRRGVVGYNPNILQSTQNYLQSRCRTFAQHNTIEKKKNITYINAQGQPLHPTNSDTGPQNFNIGNCYDQACSLPTRNTTIYKPNNTPFTQQGGVASSTRIAKLKNDIITVNGNSFRSAKAAQGKNMGKYQYITNQPCIIDSGVCHSSLYFRNGKKTVCFHTDPGNRQVQSKTTTMVYTRS